MLRAQTSIPKNIKALGLNALNLLATWSSK